MQYGFEPGDSSLQFIVCIFLVGCKLKTVNFSLPYSAVGIGSFTEKIDFTTLPCNNLPAFQQTVRQMQEIELRFQTLKDLMHFKNNSEIKELRIDTYEKSLTGKFADAEVRIAVSQFKAIAMATA